LQTLTKAAISQLHPPSLRLQAVRDSGDTAPTVHVDIDTLTFDRVLIFLEAQALRRQLPGFTIHYLDDLQQVGSLKICFYEKLIFLKVQPLRRQLPGFAIHYLDDLQQVRSHKWSNV
jgi:hypothetical protein